MTIKSATLVFPAVSFRHIETPFIKQGYKDHYAVVDTKNLPDLKNWRRINVRDPKLRGAVPTAIREGFRDHPDLFLYMNRGLVIAAEDVSYDNKTGKVSIKLSDPDLHGLLDGGHSYNIICEESQGQDVSRYVKVEILTGFNRENITDVVDARNTSNQVKDESLMNLEGAFNPLKKVLQDAPYLGQIAWKEYEIDKAGKPLPIDVREVISILMCFDTSNFTDSNHPINAYRSKAAALKHFALHQDDFKKLYPLADDFLKLYDHIYSSLPTLYNDARKSGKDVSGGRFGRLTGVTLYRDATVPLYFLGKDSSYGIPTGFIYPVLASFRSMLTEKRGKITWANGVNPVKELNGDLGLKLANALGEFALEAQNPSKTGKSPNVWASLYLTARLHFLEKSFV